MKTNITGSVSIDINAPATKVWEALTTPSIIKQYFFGTNAISDWKKGSSLIFKGEWEGTQYEDKGVILDKVEHKLFRYSYWSSMSGIEDKADNYVTVTYLLKEKDGHTTLSVTQENIKDEKTKEHSESNWKKVLQDLKQLLEKQPARMESAPLY